MANPKNRHLVEEALERELERDRTKTYVVEISPLGLVEMTRQNVTDGPREILTERCPTCSGDGVVVSMETHAVDAERRLRRHIAGSKSEAFLVELNSQVAAALIGPGASRLQELEKETGRHFAFKTKPRAAHDYFAVLAEGAAADIDPQSLPVAPGQELEVKIEEPHLHGETDAIARLDGYVVTIEDAVEKVGETVKVRIEDATRTSARAVLGDAEGEKPKKKTRRGSRGGRGRKKKVEAVAATDGKPDQPDAEAAEPEKAEPETVAEPVDGETSTTEQPKKKKTRRGTRGGRGRKRKPVESAPEAGPDGPPS